MAKKTAPANDQLTAKGTPVVLPTDPKALEALKVKVEKLLGLVKIPGGESIIGLPMCDLTCSQGEHQRKVTIKPFEIMDAPVTQELWTLVMGNNPANFQSFPDSPQRPVETVSWYDCVKFCNVISLLWGMEEYYTIKGEEVTFDQGKPGFRLPEDFEWEHAARAGCKGPRYGILDEIAWYADNSGDQTHPVRQKKPNAWGLFDMLGNVWGWTQTAYESLAPKKVTLRKTPREIVKEEEISDTKLYPDHIFVEKANNQTISFLCSYKGTDYYLSTTTNDAGAVSSINIPMVYDLFGEGTIAKLCENLLSCCEKNDKISKKFFADQQNMTIPEMLEFLRNVSADPEEDHIDQVLFVASQINFDVLAAL